MIDFHTHILPSIDDGSKSIPESVSLLRAEYRQGITQVMLTPHFYAEENSPSDFLKKRQKAWDSLKPYLWPELPKVRLGAEVQYFEGICTVEDIYQLKILGTNLLLVEMPFCSWTDRMIEDILELNGHRDTQVVLAHIERYMAKQPADIWKQLRSQGILMQTNVSFFENWKTRHQAMRMLTKGEIDFLGSDCHSMKHRRPNWEALPQKAWDTIQTSAAYKALLNETADGTSMNSL